MHGSHLLTSSTDQKPIVLITGATGNRGSSLGKVFSRDYRRVGLDRAAEGSDFPVIAGDFTSDALMELAFHKFRDIFGSRIASVVHLVGYFDFTSEDPPSISPSWSRAHSACCALHGFQVEQFVYASTMLVHAPCHPGERIDERQPIDPRWACPRLEAAAEEVIRA